MMWRHTGRKSHVTAVMLSMSQGTPRLIGKPQKLKEEMKISLLEPSQRVCQHLDLRFLASRPVRKRLPWFKPKVVRCSSSSKWISLLPEQSGENLGNAARKQGRINALAALGSHCGLAAGEHPLLPPPRNQPIQESGGLHLSGLAA